MTQFETSIGTSTADSISLLGHDLASELLGTISFGELAFWLLIGRRPEGGEARVFDAALVALADHGFTPTAIASRLTLYSAPESLQGAVAAGLLGGGSRFLGVTEDTGRFLAAAIAHRGAAASDEEWDELARDLLQATRESGGKVPGLGHPVHKAGDPRTPVLLAIAHEEGTAGPHVALFEAIGRVHPKVLGRTLPLNGAGVVGAILADMQVAPGMLRGVALLARTAGLLGHLREEQSRPVGPDVYMTVDRNATYRPVDERGET